MPLKLNTDEIHFACAAFSKRGMYLNTAHQLHDTIMQVATQTMCIFFSSPLKQVKAITGLAKKQIHLSTLQDKSLHIHPLLGKKKATASERQYLHLSPKICTELCPKRGRSGAKPRGIHQTSNQRLALLGLQGATRTVETSYNRRLTEEAAGVTSPAKRTG